MGRRTWDSLPDRFRPLPGRRNIVVTRNPAWKDEGAERAGSLDEALRLAGPDGRVFVIGGAEIYRAALPHADELVLTEVELDVAGRHVLPEVGAGRVRRGRARERTSPATGRRSRSSPTAADRRRERPRRDVGLGLPVLAAGLLPVRSRPLRVPLPLRRTPPHRRAQRDEVPASLGGAVPHLGGAGARRLPLRGQGAGSGRAPARRVRGPRSRPRRPARLRPRRRRTAARRGLPRAAARLRRSWRSATPSTSATRRGTVSRNGSPRPVPSGWTTAPGRAGWAYLRYRELRLHRRRAGAVRRRAARSRLAGRRDVCLLPPRRRAGRAGVAALSRCRHPAD